MDLINKNINNIIDIKAQNVIVFGYFFYITSLFTEENASSVTGT